MSCCDQNTPHWSCSPSAMSANERRRCEKPNNEHLACIVLRRPRNPSSHHKDVITIGIMCQNISQLEGCGGPSLSWWSFGILTLSFIQLFRSSFSTPFFGDANIFGSCDRTLVYPKIIYMISQYVSYCLVPTKRLIADRKDW